LFIYYVGRFGGRPLILKYGKYVFLSERHLVHAEKWFQKRGEVTVFVGRLLPALRTFISLPAGIAEMQVGKFILYSILGSFPWNLGLTAAGFYLGKNSHLIAVYMKPLSYIGALLLLGGVIWFWSARKRPERDTRKPDQNER
jgi:membrane protein DedA with SNARE-associated domain